MIRKHLRLKKSILPQNQLETCRSYVDGMSNISIYRFGKVPMSKTRNWIKVELHQNHWERPLMNFAGARCINVFTTQSYDKLSTTITRAKSFARNGPPRTAERPRKNPSIEILSPPFLEIIELQNIFLRLRLWKFEIAFLYIIDWAGETAKDTFSFLQMAFFCTVTKSYF